MDLGRRFLGRRQVMGGCVAGAGGLKCRWKGRFPDGTKLVHGSPSHFEYRWRHEPCVVWELSSGAGPSQSLGRRKVGMIAGAVVGDGSRGVDIE